MDRATLKLYLATDPVLLAGRDLCAVVEQAVTAGVTLVQFRDKTADGRTLLETASRLHSLTHRLGVPLIVNDRVDVMLACGAEGVHVGPKDLPPEAVRRLAPHAILGCSVNTPEDLRLAIAAGADYVGMGPAFATATKADARTVLGPAGIAELARACPLPCVAIGGITTRNCRAAWSAGVDGVCVISAILGQEDIAAAVRELLAAMPAAPGRSLRPPHLDR